MRKLLIAIALALASTAALAADRHVFLDTDGDGVLNTCPNPAHNATNTAGNTSNMTYCASGADTGKVIGTHTGYVTSCAGGVTPSNVTNGVQADVDGDGTAEFVYGAPQACVWNMAKSDSCETHAGTYRKPGVSATSTSLQHIASTTGCGKQNCWTAIVGAYGYGPNLTGTGYGTALAPGYLRGAVMDSSTDTWDPNGDKDPADSLYPAVFSGDTDNDGVFDASTGDTSGDSYYGVQVGCNAGSYDFCTTSESTPLAIDTDANGSFDDTTTIHANAKNVDYFIIKDIEFTRFNGGHANTSSGARSREGIIGLEGDGSTDGLVFDHNYIHGNDFSLQVSQENFWSSISDSHNNDCATYTDIKNNVFYQNNEKVIDDDCGDLNPCGCPKIVHDNKFVLDVTSARAAGRSLIVPFYYKSIDTASGGSRKKVQRIFNNDFVISQLTGGAEKFMDLQDFGSSMRANLGELWIYGNVFRRATGATAKMTRFWTGSCDLAIASQSYRLYMFNNTWQMDFANNTDGIYQACTDTGELVVEKNNAYFTNGVAVNPHATPTTTRKVGTCSTTKSTSCRVTGDCPGGETCTVNELCTAASTLCTVPATVTEASWFTTPGTGTIFMNLANFTPKAGGPLENFGSCDPDGDGIAGVVNYNGTGSESVNQTTWTDITGATINCANLSSTINAGAVQGGAAAPVAGLPSVKGSGTLGSGMIQH